MELRRKLGLAILVILAALLRFGGMSHDLHEGRVYHPDIPKQMHAVQHFYHGEYYWHTGNKDYDGYPLFHARVAECILRVIEPVRQRAANVLGIPTRPKLLVEELPIYWLLLTMNALLSTAMVVIVFRAGRETFGPPAGWIAATLMALSPADVTSAHLATGDVTTAFFAALSLFHSLRVFRLGRLRDYALAAAMASFAFAAKYYAATAFFALAVAHITRAGILRPAAWFSADAWRRIAIAAAAAIIALGFAIPGLFTNFTGEVTDIWVAMAHSTQRFPEWMQGAGRMQRFVFSMDVNLPDLLRTISPVAIIAVAVAMITRMRSDARVWILLIGPVLYVVLAVGSRGLVNPIYHTAITPPLFLLVAFCCTSLSAARGPVRIPAKILSASAIAIAAWFFATTSVREVFFQSQMDTRRLMETWINENVPHTFIAHTGRYTVAWHAEDHPALKLEGLVTVSSGLDTVRPVNGSILLRRFDCEDAPLTQFRNIEQTVSVICPSMLREHFSNPVLQRWPSQSGNTLLLDTGAEFLRGEKILVVNPAEEISRWLVEDHPLDEAWIVVTSVSSPANVTVSLGDQRKKIRLEKSNYGFILIENPRPQFPTSGNHFFYKLGIQSPTARMRIAIATTPAEAGRLLANIGRTAEAAPLLVSGALATKDIATAAQALICAHEAKISLPPDDAKQLAALAAPVHTVKNDDTLFDAYAIHPHYLDQLPFLRIGAGDIEVNGFRYSDAPRFGGDDDLTSELIVTTSDKTRPLGRFTAAWTPTLLLDPGRYRLNLHLRSPSDKPHAQQLRLILRDAAGKTVSERTLDIPPLDARLYTTFPAPIDIPAGLAACSIMIRSETPPDLALGGLEIRPDILANAIALAEKLKAAQAAPAPK